MNVGAPVPRKPKALVAGCKLAFFAPASPPGDFADIKLAMYEVQRLGFEAIEAHDFFSSGYFAGSTEERADGFLSALRNAMIAGLIALRGGYGTTYILDQLQSEDLGSPKCVIGFSDITALQIFLWQKHRWVTFYGPMMLGGFDHGPNDLRGFDESSFVNAVSNAKENWTVNLDGEALAAGESEGRILGGCLSLLQTTIGTGWELDTDGAILLLEDTHMKPYQVDRALIHLKQAGKFRKVRGIVLGDFPGCESPVAGSPTVREVCKRILGALGVPVVYGAPIGHTERRMLTIPLGIQGRLRAYGKGALEMLESAVLQ